MEAREMREGGMMEGWRDEGASRQKKMPWSNACAWRNETKGEVTCT